MKTREGARLLQLMKDAILCEKYKHYKNEKLYEIIGQASHTETLEELMVCSITMNLSRGNYG